MQLMTSVVPSLEALKKEGEQGRKVINQYTRYGTVLLAPVQAYGISVGLEGGNGIVTDPGLFFRISDRHHAGRRHHVPDVARRADHRARHRQRHFADHLLRHRRQSAATPSAGTLELGRTGALSTGIDPGDHRARDRRHRAHRVLRARPAPAADPVSEAPGRQPHVPGRHLAPAAEAQHARASFRRSSPRRCCCCRRRSPASRSTTQRCRAGQASILASLGHGQPLYMVLYGGDDRLLRLLLHGDRVQSEGHRRPAEEAFGGFIPGYPSGRAHRRIHRLRADAHHRDRRASTSSSSA